MGKSLEEILGRLDIAPYDQRIRRWLEKALAKFEKSRVAANQMGIIMNEKTPFLIVRCGVFFCQLGKRLLIYVSNAHR